LRTSAIRLSSGSERAFIFRSPDITTLPAGASYCGAGTVEPGRFLEVAMLNHTLVSIVDDNQPFRESPRKLVMLFGYTVEAFPSAADFLASRLLPETDCLVTDVHMPGMTGFELYRHLVDAGYAIPTILGIPG
jgi:PleD family two-component response regulator